MLEVKKMLKFIDLHVEIELIVEVYKNAFLQMLKLTFAPKLNDSNNRHKCTY